MVKNQRNSCCHMGCPPMIGDLHFHRGYSLRLQESKPLKNNGIISGEAPLFLSDGWPSYPEIFANTSSHEEPVPYSGRGRPRKPMRIIDANLKYAQVVKHKERGHLREREKRVIWGTEEEI